MLTRSFALLCAAGFLSYAHSALLTPILPLFIQEQGGTAALVGLVAAAFSAPSFLVRPFIGRTVDLWSARGVLGISTLVLGIGALGYLVYQAAVLLAVRAIHGVAWAGYTTGATVLLARVVPPQRRGEAVGYFATAQGVPLALAPATALWLLGLVGFAGVFLISAAGGLLAAAAVGAMPSQLRQEARSTGEGFWTSLVERAALLPSALELLTNLPYSAATIFIPLYATFRGIAVESLTYYFLAYGLANVATRALFGRWSDRIGRGWTIALGAAASGAALVLLSQAADIATLTIGGVLSGAGLAASGPSILALAIDRSRPARRGAAMATYSMAFQLAQGAGGVLWGVLIETAGYPAMYLTAALAPVAALLLLLRCWRATRPAPA